MSRNQITLALGLCVALCVVLSGCGAQEEVVAVVDVIESVSAKTQAEVELVVGESLVVETSGDESEEENVLQLVVEPYVPPFPDRVDLFVAPKRQGRGAAGLTDESVELLGFVNVDGQRVVLSINGLVSPLAEGSQKAGIEVISIQPPAVVLQRGRQRWQVSLEN